MMILDILLIDKRGKGRPGVPLRVINWETGEIILCKSINECARILKTDTMTIYQFLKKDNIKYYTNRKTKKKYMIEKILSPEIEKALEWWNNTQSRLAKNDLLIKYYKIDCELYGWMKVEKSNDKILNIYNQENKII